MDSKIKTKWVLGIIIFSVFAGIVIYRITNTPSTIRANTGNNAQQVSTAPGTNQAEDASASHDELTQSKVTRVNGTQQPVSDSSEAAPRIEAIFISASGKSSIYVHGEYVNEGDTIDGFKVFKIYPDRSEFERNGKIITARISAP